MTTQVAKRKPSKPKAAKRPPSREVGQLGEGEANSAHFVFGVTFDINGTLIPVNTDQLSELKTKGIELELPEDIKLGTGKEFVEWVEKEFGVKIPLAELPPPLNTIATKLSELEVTIEKAYIHVPAKENEPTLYTLKVSGVWKESTKLFGPVALKGILFGVSNQEGAKKVSVS
jgi:hypothetical protein